MQLVVDGVTTITGGVVNTQHKAVNLQVYSSYGYDQATSASTGVATCAAVDPGLAFQMQGGGNPKGTADMLVYAPCADISITSDGTTLSGALVGRKVQASGHVTVTYDSSLNGGGFLYQPKGPVPVTQYSMGSLSWCQYRTRASTGCD